MGIAATNDDQREACALGLGTNVSSEFVNIQSIGHGGLMFFIQAPIEQGLYSSINFYSLPPKHYYGFHTIITLLAFMALARIKNKNPTEINNSIKR